MTGLDLNIAPGNDSHEAFMSALNARLAEVRDRLVADEAPRERRRADRRPYSYVQLIAPYRGEMPNEPVFQEVRCHDLSTSGFSFLAARRPSFEFMVVELGVSPNVIYIIARIRRVAEIANGAEIQYLIGCEFQNRVHL